MATRDPAGETLGDILGRALGGDFISPPDDLPDVTATDAALYVWPVTDANGSVVATREVSPEDWWRNMASWRACVDIADNYGLAFEDVRTVMRGVPRNLTVLLDSAEGWAVLGEQVAITISGTLPGSPMLIAVH